MARLVRCRLCEDEDEPFDGAAGTAVFREHLRIHNIWETLPPSTHTGEYVYLGAYVGDGYFETDHGVPGRD